MTGLQKTSWAEVLHPIDLERPNITFGRGYYAELYKKWFCVVCAVGITNISPVLVYNKSHILE